MRPGIKIQFISIGVLLEVPGAEVAAGCAAILCERLACVLGVPLGSAGLFLGSTGFFFWFPGFFFAFIGFFWSAGFFFGPTTFFPTSPR